MLSVGCGHRPAAAPAAPADSTTTAAIDVGPSATTFDSPLPLPPGCTGSGSLIEADVPFGLPAATKGFVYLPACYDAQPTRTFPVLYLLHGASTDASQWLDIGLVARADTAIASGAIGPMIIVMPEGGPGIPDGFVDELVDRLVPWTDHTFRTLPTRAGRAVGGISRGGRIAVLAAATRPDLFAAAGGHSPVLSPSDATTPIVAGLARADGITLDVGASDPLRTDVDSFARVALHGVTVATSPGGHDRGYWRAHVADYLIFYGDHLHG